MSTAAEIRKLALQLPARSRLKLVRELLSRDAACGTPAEALAEATRRDREIENGTIAPLDEATFWQGVTRRVTDA